VHRLHQGRQDRQGVRLAESAETGPVRARRRKSGTQSRIDTNPVQAGRGFVVPFPYNKMV
jgi:hypothetical protein